MTPAERVAWALAERLGDLDAAAMCAHGAFREAVDQALGVADERGAVEAVVRQGCLGGARNPHAVIVSRLRKLPSLAGDRQRMADARAIRSGLDAPELRAAQAAAERGIVLGAHVERALLSRQEALATIETEFRGGLVDAALDAFEGRCRGAGAPGRVDYSRSLV